MDKDTATNRLVLALLILVIVILVFVVSAGNAVISGISDPDAIGLEATYKSEDLGVKTTEKLRDAEESTREGDAEHYSNITAGSSVTCTSCEDCTRKLNNGFYDTVILSQNILNHTGDCITLSTDNVVFDCSGYFISGDLPAAPFNVDYGIKVTGDNNVITNCNVGLFWYGIWLDSANFTTITENNLALNGYAGLTLANSNNNILTANTLNFNSYGLAILNSHNTVINSNAACGNLIADIWQENASGNAGSNNTCYNIHNWNDTGTKGCTHLCCLVPSNDMRIEKDTKLCPGWYNITDSGAQGAIIINASDIVLDGNGAVINGSGSGYGIYNPGFDNVTITNVTLLNYGTGIQLVESDNSIILENDVSYSATTGIAIDSSYQCDVSHNRVSYSAERGIAFDGGGDNAAYKNVVFNNSAFGAIEAVSSDNNEIYNNTAYGNQWGVATNHGSSNKIHNNTMYGNELGVHLDWPSTNNRVVNNKISSNYAGIWVNHNSTDNIISDNLIVANEAAGIGVETNSNLITNNTAHNNRVGLYLGAATAGNTVTHNSFCNNVNFDIRDDNSNSGDENTCDTQNGWDDEGTTGCTYTCVSGGSDLIITDIWSEGEFIWYQVRNIGNETALGGHWTGLLVDGVYRASEQVAAALAPGERYTGYFDYSWWCTGGEDVIAAVADYNHHVPEANETNNQREEVWKCDTTQPRIISGPTVSEVTQTSALITWETDEASDSVVKYGKRARKYAFEETGTNLVLEHTLTLTNLEPATTYNVVVQSTDASGNSVMSKDMTFEARPLLDENPPEISLIDPGSCEGLVTFSADAEDDTRVERVEFFIDGELVFTDYSSPYRAIIDTNRYENGGYELTGRVFDLTGKSSEDHCPINVVNVKDEKDPSVTINYPAKDQIVSGEVTVNASVSDDTGIFYGIFWVDGNWSGTWYPEIEGVKQTTINFPWYTTLWENGKHRIAFQIYDLDWNSGNGTQDVLVNNLPPPPPPDLKVTSHDYIRKGNYFTVELTVKNTGGETATKVRLLDYLQLFQPISYNTTTAHYSAVFKPELTSWEMHIESQVDIPPGESRTFTYDAVPVMIYPNLVNPVIGGNKYGYSTRLWCEPPGGLETYYKEVDMASLPFVSYENALGTADYLIVTSPKNLLIYNSEEEVNALLSSMAELAKLKNGVLGYLDVATTLPRKYEAHDGFAVGDLVGDGREEIVIGDEDTGYIHVYKIVDKSSSYGTPESSFERKNWVEYRYFNCGGYEEGFDEGDRIAVGNLLGDTHEEIVMADASRNVILIYAANGSIQGSFGIDFEAFDGLAVGDVNGDGKGEIVVADRSEDKIYMYKFSGGYTSAFSLDYDIHDGLAVGDVLYGDAKEIIVADRSKSTVYIVDKDGNQLGSFGCLFDETGSGLAVGNVGWGPKDEIIIGYEILGGSNHDYYLTGAIDIYDSSGKTLKTIPYIFGDFYGLAAGRVTSSSTDWWVYDELLVANSNTDMIYMYDVDQNLGDPYVLKDLIQHDSDFYEPSEGEWSSKLKSDWTTNGYLLIVGETEIVPAFGGFNFGTYVTPKGDRTFKVDCSDLPYASTWGDFKPELSIGRIIGNTAKDLRIPIETSINVSTGVPGYGFDRSHAFLVSGYTMGLGGGADPINFKKETDGIAQILTGKGVSVLQMHTPDYTIYILPPFVVDQTATKAAINTSFWTNAADRDVIHLAGHGNTLKMDEIYIAEVMKQVDPFGTTSPFIFASSCLTGRYHDNFVIGLAEAFLKKVPLCTLVQLRLEYVVWGLILLRNFMRTGIRVNL